MSANASASEQKQSYNYLSPRAVTPEGWNDYGRASLDFSWELDFWGRNRAALAAATSEAEAVTNYDRAVIQALQEVADAAVSQKALGSQIARTDEAVEAAREAWEIQNNRYEGGLATYLDVLAAEDTLLSNLRTQWT